MRTYRLLRSDYGTIYLKLLFKINNNAFLNLDPIDAFRSENSTPEVPNVVDRNFLDQYSAFRMRDRILKNFR